MIKSDLTANIKNLALQAGFADVGITDASDLIGQTDYENWLKKGYHAGMDYLANNLDKRYSPSAICDNAKSVICLLVSFSPSQAETNPRNKLIASYAQGRDYHKVLKKRAHNLCDAIKKVAPSFEGRAFVDTAPIAERQLAVRAGLGWLGKSGIFISPTWGNQIFLAEIICNIELDYDTPIDSQCADCSACISNCPTNAILADGKIDANKCLSYHTIENRGEIPQNMLDKVTQSIFGCDECITLCQFCKSAKPGDPEFMPTSDCENLTLSDLLKWSYDDWDNFTRGGARRRATYEMYLRNAILLAANTENQNDSQLINQILEIANRNPNLARYAKWAIKKVKNRNQH